MASRSDTTADANAPAESVAQTLSTASFVRVISAADGDALAAAGLLARGLRHAGVPFQVRVASLGADAPAATDGVLAAVGSTRQHADVTIAPDDGPASLRAHEIAETLGGAAGATADAETAGIDPVLALAGVVAAGSHPGRAAGPLVERAVESGALDRRPGVAVPTDDVVDGLAHSTLVRAPFSGDAEAVASELDGVVDPETGSAPDAEAHRSIASLVALAVAGDADATPTAATAVERLLRPYATADGPMATLGGFADVLNAVAGERPGVGVALALGHGGSDAALDAWRAHGTAVHRALTEAHTGRYDGVFAVRSDVDADRDSALDGRLGTVARLALDFRSPEPLVAALDDGVAAIAARDAGAKTAASALASEFPSEQGGWTGDATSAVARFDPATSEADVIAAIREAVR